MRAYGNKRITPVYGDYRPRERRWNNIKLHGWHNEERTGDTAVEWEDTYNDYVGGTFGGRSELQAEYYASEGDSEQTGTPTPDAPIPITPYLPAGTYKITMPDATYELTLPTDMHGVGGIRDRVVVDYVSKRGWLDGRYGYIASYSGESISTPYMSSTGELTEGATIVYQLATPTKTALTLTKVTTSTAPELPLEFLADASSVSPDLPATIESAQPVVTARGRNLLPHPLDIAKYTLTNYQNRVLISQDKNEVTVSALHSDNIDTMFSFISPLFNLPPNSIIVVSFYAYVHIENWYFQLVRPTGTCTQLLSESGDRIQATSDITDITQDKWKQYNFIITTNENTKYRIQIGSDAPNLYGDGSYIKYKNIQIEQSSTPHPYTPYRAPTTLEFPELRAIALPETATEWTYIRDGVKYWADTANYVGGGWWDVTKQVEIQRVPNNRMWNRSAEASWTSLQRVQVTFSPAKKIGLYTLGYCSHFGVKNNGIATISTNLMSVYPTNNIIYWFPKYQIFGLNGDETNEEADAALNSWLQNNEVWISYIRATPTTTRLHLGTLKSYPRYTHVEQITDGVRADMQLTAKVVDRC